MNRRRFAVALGLCWLLTLAVRRGAAEEDLKWRRRPVHLPPLAWYDSDPHLNKSFLMLGCIYWRGRGPGQSLDALVPLYYATDTPQHAVRGITPLFWQAKHTNGKRATFVGPLFIRKGGGEEAMSLAPLFWHSKKESGPSRTILLPLFYRKADSSVPLSRGYAGLYGWDIWRDRRRHVLFPIFWYNARDGRATWVVPPLYGSSKATSKSVGLYPLVKSYQEGEAKGFRFWPLVDCRRQGSKGSHTYVFPYWGLRSDNHRFDSLIPFVWLNREGQGSLSILGPFYSVRSSGTKYLGLFPLVGFRRAADGTSHGGHLLPYFWHRSAAKKNDVLFPVLWRFRRKTSSKLCIPPFYLSKSVTPAGSRSSVGFWPLVWHKRDPARCKWGVLPLAACRRDEKTDRSRGYVGLYIWDSDPNFKRILFPLYWRTKGHNRSLTLLFPYYSSRRHGKESVGVFPLYRRKKEGRTASSYLLPVYYRRHNDATDETKNWCGPYYHRRNAEGKVTTVVPVYWRRVKGDAVKGLCTLYYWADRPGAKSRVLFPVWWAMAKGEGKAAVKSAVVPPFYSKRGPDLVKKGMFPLIWYHREGSHKHMAGLPVFWRRDTASTSKGFCALFWWSDRPGSALKVLFPFLWVHDRGAGSQRVRTIVAPPFYSQSGSDRAKAGLFPFAWYHREGQSDSLAILPIYYRSKGAGRSFSMTGPLWLRHHGTDRSGGLFPLVWLKRQPAASSTIVAPIWWTKRGPERGRSACLTGPYFWRKSKGSHTQVLFPVWWRFDDSTHRLSVVPPVYWQTGPAKRKLGLFPLAWRHRSDESQTVGILPIFWRDTQTSPKRSRGLVGPYYWNRGQGADFRVVFPFYWRHQDGISSRLVVPPFYHMRRSDASQTLLAPLFWRSTKGHASRTAVLPLFYRSRAPNASALLTPLSWYQRTGGSETGLIGPYYWDIDVKKRERSNVVFPIYWRFKNPTATDRAILPFYYCRKGDRGTVRIVLPILFDIRKPNTSLRLIPPVYIRTKTRDNWRRISVVPIFTRERDDTGYRYLGFFGGLFSHQTQVHQGRTKRRVTFLWLIRIPI